RPMARDNRTLGKFHLVGIPPAPRGVPQIEVAFDLDANGILNVSARDLATGREQKITITASSGLSKEEVEKMAKDADAHSEEDKRRLAEIEIRNKLDNMVYAVEKLIKENRDKLNEGDVQQAEVALEEARKALQEGKTERMGVALDTLTQASHKLAQQMYQQAAAAASAPPGDSAGGEKAEKPKEGEVIDAEYVDMDETKKPN
ncbi:MAG: Hsp70 family protein, partial [Candidatus Acidiferrales bacterium]